MSGRTYVLDADMCDRAESILSGYPHPTMVEMVDAIRAQQPKLRIRPKTGMKIRPIGPRPATWIATAGTFLVCIDDGDGATRGTAVVPTDLIGYDIESDTFDPELWEVVE